MLILKGSDFQASVLSLILNASCTNTRLTQGTVRSFLEEDRRDLEGEYEDTQQER